MSGESGHSLHLWRQWKVWLSVCLSCCLPPPLPFLSSLIGFSSAKKPGKDDRYMKPDREKRWWMRRPKEHRLTWTQLALIPGAGRGPRSKDTKAQTFSKVSRPAVRSLWQAGVRVMETGLRLLSRRAGVWEPRMCQAPWGSYRAHRLGKAGSWSPSERRWRLNVPVTLACFHSSCFLH